MKFLMVLFSFVSLFSSSAFADWVCKAYCEYDGYTLLTEHAEHPVDALQEIQKRCAVIKYSDETSSTKIYSEPKSGSEQATIENACSYIDISKY
jgi:hypothetical protein